MADFGFFLGYVGFFMLAIVVGYELLGVIMFCVYKFLDKGKMGFFEYMKRWD